MPLEQLLPDEMELRYGLYQGLLPGCPFCGQANPFLGSSVNDTPLIAKNGPIYQARITCGGIRGCRANVFHNDRTREAAQQGAIAAWSRRAPAETSPASPSTGEPTP